MEAHRLKPTVLATLALLAAACSGEAASPADPSHNGAQGGIVAGTLEVTAANGTVTLRNTTERQVGYMVVDKDQMVIAMYPPCGTTCPVVVQGAQATIPYAQIPGYTPKSSHASVMWWRYTVKADGSRVPEGAMQTKIVQLK